MLQNYLLTALRNLRKNKLNAFLNFAGLGIGLACCLLIALYIAGELRYDRFHAKAERVWRVTRTFHDQDGAENLHLSAIAPPFKTLLPQHFPEIEQITSILFNSNVSIRTEDNRLFTENNVFFADEHLFDVFTLETAQGEGGAGLAAPWQVLLSESAAKRYFGERNPLDQPLRFDNQFRFKVAGVYRDFPESSHWHPDLLLSFSSLRDSSLYGADRLLSNFGNNAFYTYFVATPGFDPAKMAARFPKFLDDVFPPPPPGVPNTRKPHEFTQLHLQRLTDIHLRSSHDDEIEPGGDAARVRMFGIIALVILLIAGINYVNLATAFALGRAREIGVRKSAGAQRGQIVAQFLAESALIAVGGGALALGLSAAATPLLKNALQVEMAYTPFSHWSIPVALLGAALCVGLIAGIYPAFSLSAFRPVQVLKGALKAGKSGLSMRKALVISQFGISTILLVGTLVIYRQLQYLQSKSLGLNKEQIVNLAPNNNIGSQWDAFRAELLSNPQVAQAARSSRIPSGRLLDDLGGTSVQLGDTMSQLTTTLKMLAVDMDFVPTYQIPMAAGRAFSRDFPSDTTQAWLINEAAARAIGWKTAEEAVGKRLIYGGRQDCYVVGVMKDFHFESLHQEIVPMILFIPRSNNFYNVISVKTGGDTQAGLAHIERVWQKFSPDFAFDYQFLDENYGRLYEAEMRQGQLYTVFSGLAVLIACLGLFGLAAFAAHQRTKEIGIRKVLGATTAGVTGLLAKDFLQLVLVAIVVASPIAWYLMNRWLADFAYRIEVQWWMFAVAGALSVLIAFATVSFQSVKAALTNPVKSLKSE